MTGLRRSFSLLETDQRRSADTPITSILCADVAEDQSSLFPQGCLYRERAIHALEKQKQPWRIAYTSASLTGILAAVSSGLAVTLLAKAAVPANLHILNGRSGFPNVPATELALVAHRERIPSPAVEQLANFISRSIGRPRRKAIASS